MYGTLNICSTDQFASCLCGASLSQCIYISTHRYLSPHTRLGLLCETTTRMHHQHAIGCQSIHLAIWILPFCCFFLWIEEDGKELGMCTKTSMKAVTNSVYIYIYQVILEGSTGSAEKDTSQARTFMYIYR